MSKSSRICFSIFGIVLPRASLPFRCHWQIGWLRLRFLLYGKDAFQVLRLDYPLALALKHDELDERGHLVEPAEEPDEKNDRDGYTDQPQQKTSTHSFLLYRWFPHLTSALNLRSNRCQGRESLRCRGLAFAG